MLPGGAPGAYTDVAIGHDSSGSDANRPMTSVATSLRGGPTHPTLLGVVTYIATDEGSATSPTSPTCVRANRGLVESRSTAH